MRNFICLIITIFFTTQAFAAKNEEIMIEDVVKDVMTQGSVERVRFNLHAGIYYLKQDQKDFKKIKEALVSSQVTQKKVKVSADPTYLEITSLVP